MVSPDTQMAPAGSHSSEVLNYRIKGSHSLLFRFNFFGYGINLVLNKVLLSHCPSGWRGLGWVGRGPLTLQSSTDTGTSGQTTGRPPGCPEGTLYPSRVPTDPPTGPSRPIRPAGMLSAVVRHCRNVHYHLQLALHEAAQVPQT